MKADDRLRRVASSAPVDRVAARGMGKGVAPISRPDDPSPGKRESDTPMRTEPFPGLDCHDITGKTFGRFTVVGFLFAGKANPNGTPWVVRCSCGRYAVRRSKSMRRNPQRMMCRECDYRNQLATLGFNPKGGDSMCKRRRELRESLLAVTPRCFYCQRPLERDTATLDHLHPRSKGGTDDPENLVLACRPCNRAKGAAV